MKLILISFSKDIILNQLCANLEMNMSLWPNEIYFILFGLHSEATTLGTAVKIDFTK